MYTYIPSILTPYKHHTLLGVSSWDTAHSWESQEDTPKSVWCPRRILPRVCGVYMGWIPLWKSQEETPKSVWCPKRILPKVCGVPRVCGVLGVTQVMSDTDVTSVFIWDTPKRILQKKCGVPRGYSQECVVFIWDTPKRTLQKVSGAYMGWLKLVGSLKL